MIFRPYVPRIMDVRSGGMASETGPAPTRAMRSVMFPVGRTLDLLTIPGATNQKDFFLWHPYQNSIQDVLVSTDTNVAAPAGGLICQLVQINGLRETVLNREQSFSSFTIEPDPLPSPGEVLDGPVFLRVKSIPADLLLHVTIQALTPEVP